MLAALANRVRGNFDLRIAPLKNLEDFLISLTAVKRNLPFLLSSDQRLLPLNVPRVRRYRKAFRLPNHEHDHEHEPREFTPLALHHPTLH